MTSLQRSQTSKSSLVRLAYITTSSALSRLSRDSVPLEHLVGPSTGPFAVPSHGCRQGLQTAGRHPIFYPSLPSTRTREPHTVICDIRVSFARSEVPWNTIMCPHSASPSSKTAWSVRYLSGRPEGSCAAMHRAALLHSDRWKGLADSKISIFRHAVNEHGQVGGRGATPSQTRLPTSP